MLGEIMTVFDGIVNQNGIFHHEAVQNDPRIAFHYPDCIDCGHKSQAYGNEHTQNEDHDAGLDIAFASLVFQHGSTYFQYFSDSPERVTDTVTGILKIPSPFT